MAPASFRSLEVAEATALPRSRSFSFARAGAALVMVALAFAPTSRTALAAETGKPASAAPPSAQSRASARASFERGEKAFAAGKFAEAGEAFEKAYSFVQHPDVLLNAAKAWQKGGELARAANLFDKYLRTAPDDSPDRKVAVASLDKLASKLGRLNINAPGAEEVELDEGTIPLEGSKASVYVSPGTHIVRARIGAENVQRTQAVDAGGVASVALVAEPPPPKIEKAPIVGTTAPVKVKEEPPRPLPPMAVIIGGGVTAVLLGTTVWSGVDTLSALDEFNAAKTQDRLDAGRAKQTRTNVLIGVTVSAAALTTAAAIWLVRWDSPTASAKVGFGAGALRASGSF